LTPQAQSRSIIRPLAWDIVLNTTIPLICYELAKRIVSASEFEALIAATLFPVLKSGYDVARRRQASPVAVLVILGIVVSIVALFVGGDPRLLLIRESFVTAGFGVACLLSLPFRRPLMFYFGRYFMTAGDPERRRTFEDRLRYPTVQRLHRVVTAVWGVAYVLEFTVRAILVFTVPAAVVIAVSPLLIGATTMIILVWTFRAARGVEAGLPT
jgi:hypothetical protein